MYFKSDTHQYFINGKNYKSFSSLIKLVEPEKNWEEIAEKYAKKHSTKKDPLTKEDVQASWAESSRVSKEKGTLFHALKEDEDINNVDKPVYYSLTNNHIKPIRNLETLEDGVYPELTLYNNKYEACGTADKVIIETINGIRYADVLDYKGLALDTPIPTKYGWKLMKDISIGDIIFDGEGNLTKVKHISEIHYNPCYRITFDTGETVICDHEHKWEISYRKGKDQYKEECYTTEYLNKNFHKLKLKKLPRVKCTSIKLIDIELPIDPYILGLWLGDGDKSCGRLTCMNQDIWDEIIKRGYSLSGDHTRNDKRTEAETRTIYGIQTQLKELNLLKNKHIPDIFIRSSHNQRLDLLRGFMDSDGYFNRKRNRCVMATTQEWQMKEMLKLTTSLGYKTSVIKAIAQGFGKKVPKYDICFTTKESPFLIRNKDYVEIMSKTKQDHNSYRIITSIEKIDTVPTKCIAVESKKQTYLFGYSYIKTHNTSKEITMESYFDGRSQRHAMLEHPLQSVMDCNFMKYSLQLSTYAFFLEKYNFVPRHLILIHLVIKELEEDIPTKYKIDFEGKKYYVAEEIEYPVKYMKKEVIALLEYHKSKLK